MKNVVPFQPPAKFAQFDFDWRRAARTETERSLREAFLTYKTLRRRKAVTLRAKWAGHSVQVPMAGSTDNQSCATRGALVIL
jgi:hypothetical protein